VHLKMLDRLKHDKLSPNMAIYNVLILGLFKSRMVDQALQMFEEMKCSGFKPDEKMYNTIVEGCLMNNKISEALELFMQLRREGIWMAENNVIRDFLKFQNKQRGNGSSF